MADKLNQFSARAQRALALAQAEAQRLNHECIELEHLLLGLALEAEKAGTGVLKVLKADLSLIRGRMQQAVEQEQQSFRGDLQLTSGVEESIKLAVDEARKLGHSYIGTGHLLLGLLREGSGVVNEVLAEMGIGLEEVRNRVKLMHSDNLPALVSSSRLARWGLPAAISPVFGVIVLITIVAGYLAYRDGTGSGLTIFAFVTGGWIISLCLHEFGHAAVAFWGGDEGVADKGYLTLNPFKYAHGLLSVVLPLFYLTLGGLGLPGGAVYINDVAIRRRSMRSLSSAAGPITTAVFAAILVTPFAVGLASADLAKHFEFWAGLALLASLQVGALFFSLLPIPGLDGFGIIAPHLPDNVLAKARGFQQYTLFVVFILFSSRPFSQGFWAVIRFVTSLVNLDYFLIYQGLRLYQFWAT